METNSSQRPLTREPGKAVAPTGDASPHPHKLSKTFVLVCFVIVMANHRMVADPLRRPYEVPESGEENLWTPSCDEGGGFLQFHPPPPHKPEGIWDTPENSITRKVSLSFLPSNPSPSLSLPGGMLVDPKNFPKIFGHVSSVCVVEGQWIVADPLSRPDVSGISNEWKLQAELGKESKGETDEIQVETMVGALSNHLPLRPNWEGKWHKLSIGHTSPENSKAIKPPWVSVEWAIALFVPARWDVA
jgi:hypothetical protein